MAQTPEGKVKDWVKRRLKAAFPSAYIYPAPGGQFGVAGTPDLLCCVEGIFVAIEVKTDVGRLSALQMKRLKEIQIAGGIAAVIYGKDEVRMNRIIRTIQEKLNVS